MVQKAKALCAHSAPCGWLFKDSVCDMEGHEGRCGCWVLGMRPRLVRSWPSQLIFIRQKTWLLMRKERRTKPAETNLSKSLI